MTKRGREQGISLLLGSAVIEAEPVISARLSHLIGVPLSELDLNSTSHALFMEAPLLIGFAGICVPRHP